MVAWLEKAVMLRKNREEIDQNRANLSEKLATRADLVAVLTESIRAIGRELPPSQRLEPLLAGARDIVAEIEQIEAKRTKLHAGLARDQRQIKQKRKAEADGMAALEKLEQAWQAILDATWLPRELRPETFSEMLALLEQFRTADTKARSDQERADGIERDTAAFRADVVAVAVEHAPDLEALADKAPDSVVTTLADRLAQAQTAHDRRADREEVLERARLSRDATQVRLQGITDQLSSLAITVGVERDAFEQVVARSKETLKIRRDIDSLREDVETGTGLSLETCDVEFAGRTRADLDGDLVVARENERSLVGERDDVFAKKREIEAELSAMENSELAANAEAEIIAIGAQIDQDARHWAELTLARFVLDEQIREYADKNQGALIARSGHFFRRLTAGAYQKLRAVSEDNKNYLEAVDQKDRSTRVDGLSEGTRDQLYFALRLAALEHHFKDNEAQPVILDDAFVAFDDQRSKLAFEVMAEFAKTTQVIYFTHHYACVESAIAAVPSGMLNVHKLPSRWESEIPANSAVLAGTPALRRVGPLALTIAAFEV